ncbi:hypothetical protein ACCUM_2158 [Candidatus Accumulibacter phosphatis]|uniref:Uncharacterized protein n=1 Tax=Candidatus Accumulibacter phosphatis TaxID=327160 RepID=A0A5S4FBL2_9PROT|nr:hypothetical protein ACCUM_2158 [Candidatus Accumulibacter phosphatis]
MDFLNRLASGEEGRMRIELTHGIAQEQDLDPGQRKEACTDWN